jgi:hypothetical protein
MTPERWGTLTEQLREIDALPANSEPAGKAFTAEFLPRD